MTRVCGLTTALLLTVSALAADHRELAAQAMGCVTTELAGCSLTERAELGSGDCIFTTGAFYDRYTLTLARGQAVAITLRPLDPTLTNPDLIVLKPSFQPSTPPEVTRGPAASVWIKPMVTGTWTILASTEDLGAGGRYALHVDCFEDDSAGADCVEQELLCGNIGFGRLTDEACRFSNNRPYNEWLVWGVEGDRLRLIMTSAEFAPAFGIYDFDDGRLLRAAEFTGDFGAMLDYRVLTTGWYSIRAASRTTSIGDYAIQLNCDRSGCLFPYIIDAVPSVVSAPLGQPATIGVNVHSIFPFTTYLFGADIQPVATSSNSSITTPPVTSPPQRYFIRVENECGSFDSNSFLVAPESSKRRAARH